MSGSDRSGVARWLLLMLCTLAALGAVPVAAEIVNPDGPADALLAQLAPLLETRGIDVALGIATDLELGQRARLARLAGYSAAGKEWLGFTTESWISGFEQGLLGGIAGLRQDASALEDQERACASEVEAKLLELCKFVKEWVEISPDRRVFVAFTRDDETVAAGVEDALRENGYAVFTYLKKDGGEVLAPPELVGEVFAQASDRLVIDTRSARGSVGVAFEALCCSVLLEPARPPSDHPLVRRIQETPR